VLVVGDSGGIWTLQRRTDGRTIASLVVVGGDFPWLSARVEPGEGFVDFLPLFAEELTQLERIDDDGAAWDRAYDAVRDAVTLRYPNGDEVPEFLLHVDGTEAWWRWNDEPFADEQDEE
jgi:hypothetical protein